ncbi:hypothetical protein ACFL6D_03180, partial [Spirochaetota bacterium]
EYITAPGVRIGYVHNNILIGYSQADYRHLTPLALIAAYTPDRAYIRFVIQVYNRDPKVWHIELYTYEAEISCYLEGSFHDVTFMLLPEIIYSKENGVWARIEEACEWKGLLVSLRQIITDYTGSLYEASVQKYIHKQATLGIHAATDGRIYIGSKIEF